MHCARAKVSNQALRDHAATAACRARQVTIAERAQWRAAQALPRRAQCSPFFPSTPTLCMGPSTARSYARNLVCALVVALIVDSLAHERHMEELPGEHLRIGSQVPFHVQAPQDVAVDTSELAEAQGEAAPVEGQPSHLPTSNGHTTPESHTEATPPRSLSEPPHQREAQDVNRQSPASALADLLSSLELSTPAAPAAPDRQHPEEAHAANGHAPSKPEAETPAWAVGAEQPRKAQAGDVAVGLVYDPLMEDHTGPPGHVERPQRTAVLAKALQDTGLAARCWKLPSRQASDGELLRAHTEAHVRSMSGSARGGDRVVGDNFFSEGTPLACRLAAGCTVQAVEAVCAGEVARAFAVVRPPGHHAECARAMGFCFYNNVAVGALHALSPAGGGCRRVLVLDWDVHHGNGIEEILYARADAMYVSLHRGNGFYPGTGDVADLGKGPGRGFNLNIPFPRGGFNDADYVAAFDLVLEPVIAAYAPDLVIVSAGFDAVVGDPLGGMCLSPELYGHLTARLIRLAPKLVLALEGGYNLRQTAECAVECTKVLLGGQPTPLDRGAPWRPAKEMRAVLAEVAAAQAPFWPVLEPLATPEGFKATWDGYLLGKQTEASLHLRRSPRGPKSAAL